MCDRCGCVFVAPCEIQRAWFILCSDCCELYNGTPISSKNVASDEMNSLSDIVTRKPGLSWAAFVAKWNTAQPFHDDIYAIPKKGGMTYDDVKELYDRQRGVKPEPKPEPVKSKPKYEYPEKPTWDDLINVRGEYWLDKLATGFGGKVWAIPMLPKPSREADLVKQTFPTLKNSEINAILKGANQARRAAKKE